MPRYGAGRVALAPLLALTILLSSHHPVNHRPGYPAWWKREAACIRYQESRGLWHLDTGNGFYGAYQFARSTWRAHLVKGWPLNPAKASPPQQTFIAWRNWIANGRRWGGSQWPLSARACGFA